MKLTNIPGAGREIGRPDPSDRDAFDAWAADLAGITVEEWRNRRRSHDTEQRSTQDQDLEQLRARIVARLNATPSPRATARPGVTTRTAHPATDTTPTTTTRTVATPAAHRARIYGVRR